ncbi:outer membrane beta-barrel protein [Helicobacter felis]|uniref:outer membrane beta-barrel protein n=1 Tax=Helicobacter felis TaxID=214 RepID=UPI00131546A3|nr:outer membrane beta-barrel protein [Helicobacter felis]
MGLGFQYSVAQSTPPSVTDPVVEDYFNNLYGGDFQIDYKNFFGNNKLFGLRSFLFFSGQSMGLPPVVAAKPSVNFFYGAGYDMLFNVYGDQDSSRTFGFFLGAMFGGTTWLTKKGQPVDLTRVAMFQLMINAGVRTNISVHQGVEVGVRVPVIPYRSYAIGRVVAVFANYVVNF